MAQIAEKRGMKVKSGIAEDLPYEDAEFDTVLMNGTPSYINDLGKSFDEAFRVLKPGGNILVVDVPAESSYGLLYRLPQTTDSWGDPYLQKKDPPHPHPGGIPK